MAHGKEGQGHFPGSLSVMWFFGGEVRLITPPAPTALEGERWLAETFRPSAMVWVLRRSLDGPRKQAELVDAGRVVGYSVAAIRHAIEVGRRTGILRVEKSPGGGRSYAISATDVGHRLAETPMKDWDDAGSRGKFRDAPVGGR
jgi:hypothetical protein